MESISKSSETIETILDSSLITPTFYEKPKLYNCKIIDCGSFVQVYFYTNARIKNPNKEDNVDLNLKKIDVEAVPSKKTKPKNLTNKIEEKNITRSKLQCQRIAKANMEYWETFITLTFADNVTDVEAANKRFRYFVDKIRRVKKDFRYICVPEFQERGAVHYHLLTNISINDKLMYEQEDNPEFKHIKYWSEGFTKVDNIKGDVKKIIGYISKYMTKDVDNRLYGRRRFFYSQNCIVPKVSYIDSVEKIDLIFLNKKIQDKELIYQNEYLNIYDKTTVQYLEYQLSDSIVSQNKEN